jgi:hypothetical protein
MPALSVDIALRDPVRQRHGSDRDGRPGMKVEVRGEIALGGAMTATRIRER